MACSPRGCNCALAGSGVAGGSGQSGDPYLITTGVASVVTSGTRPGSPVPGELIYESDTERTYMYDGASWRIQHDPNGVTDINVVPAGVTDATVTSTFTSWLPLGNVTVPPWATACDGDFQVTGHYLQAAATYAIQPRLAATAPDNDARDWLSTLTETTRRTTSVSFPLWTGLTPGATLALAVYAAMTGGTGPMRADTSSRVVAKLNWREF